LQWTPAIFAILYLNHHKMEMLTNAQTIHRRKRLGRCRPQRVQVPANNPGKPPRNNPIVLLHIQPAGRMANAQKGIRFENRENQNHTDNPEENQLMDVVLAPDKRLLTPAEPMADRPAASTIVDMWRLLKAKHGAGLAANQVGLPGAFFIARFSFGPAVCINPRIVRHGKELLETHEGCLSVLDGLGQTIFKPKKRWAVVDVEYSTMAGLNTTIERTLKRMDARIFQHEMDHMAGRLCHDEP
jgi:peptide deformylase